MSPFDREREGFQILKERFPSIEEDFRRALLELHQRYSTRVRENRFVVGGATEIVVGAALRACGIPVVPRGTQTLRWDLVFEDRQAGYSVKSMLRAPSTTRLVNTQSRSPSPADWDVATLFLLPEGLVYADPALPWWRSHRSEIRVRSDALVVSRTSIRNFAAQHPEWKIPCPISLPEDQDRARVRTASYDLALTVLKDLGGLLFKNLPDLLE